MTKLQDTLQELKDGISIKLCMFPYMFNRPPPLIWLSPLYIVKFFSKMFHGGFSFSGWLEQLDIRIIHPILV